MPRGADSRAARRLCLRGAGRPGCGPTGSRTPGIPGDPDGLRTHTGRAHRIPYPRGAPAERRMDTVDDTPGSDPGGVMVEEAL
ncbi:hypothetical protein GCM10027160_20830 [Streptomyces calidiresistens]